MNKYHSAWLFNCFGDQFGMQIRILTAWFAEISEDLWGRLAGLAWQQMCDTKSELLPRGEADNMRRGRCLHIRVLILEFVGPSDRWGWIPLFSQISLTYGIASCIIEFSIYYCEWMTISEFGSAHTCYRNYLCHNIHVHLAYAFSPNPTQQQQKSNIILHRNRICRSEK